MVVSKLAAGFQFPLVSLFAGILLNVCWFLQFVHLLLISDWSNFGSSAVSPSAFSLFTVSLSFGSLSVVSSSAVSLSVSSSSTASSSDVVCQLLVHGLFVCWQFIYR